MNNTFLVPRLAESLGKHWPQGSQSCGLVNCPRPKSLWRRLWRDRNSVRFDGTLYSHSQCLESALQSELWRLQNQTLPAPPPNRIPLGLLMMARGKLTYAEVSAALEAQRRAQSGNIGEWLEKLGFASERDVTAALGLQWGCPVASSLPFESNGASQRVPFVILEDCLIWPLHHVAASNTLYIACGKRVDFGVFSAIGEMLSCRTQPCVASPRKIADRVERARCQPHPGEIEFRSTRDAAEMARIASSYIARLGADEARISRAGDFIWLLLKSRRSSLNLTFQLRSELQPVQESGGTRMNDFRGETSFPVRNRAAETIPGFSP